MAQLTDQGCEQDEAAGLATFEDVSWSDECTVQMESHRRFVCRIHGEAPHPKPRFVNKH